MEFGQLIKIERLKNDMKQDNLSRGICSSSYLSKIESGSVIPSDEIQQLLLKKLLIQYEPLSDTLSSGYFIQLNERFNNVLSRRDTFAATSLCNEISTVLLEHPLYQHKISLLLMETRLMLMNGELFAKAREKICLIGNIKNSLSQRQLFQLKLIEGIVAYKENRFRDATELFMFAYDLTKKSRMEDWELAELHYVSSVTSLAEFDYILAMNHAKIANEYFNKEMLTERSLECMFILSIAQKRFGHVKDALSSFVKMSSLVKNTSNLKYQGLIEHNIGACHSLLRVSNLALFHYKKSLEFKVNPDDRAVTMLAIIKEYHKYGDIENAKNWLTNAFNLLAQLSEKKQIFYFNHFAIYKAVIFEDDNYLSVFKKVLLYLIGKRDYKHLALYSNVLAEKLLVDGQYKLATTYFKDSFDYYLKTKNLKSWEELT